MSAVTKIPGQILGGIGSAVGSLFSTPKAPEMAPLPTRDDVEVQAGELRRLRQRRGSGANQLLGDSGAEAATQPVKRLTGE